MVESDISEYYYDITLETTINIVTAVKTAYSMLNHSKTMEKTVISNLPGVKMHG